MNSLSVQFVRGHGSGIWESGKHLDSRPSSGPPCRDRRSELGKHLIICFHVVLCRAVALFLLVAYIHPNTTTTLVVRTSNNGMSARICV